MESELLSSIEGRLLKGKTLVEQETNKQDRQSEPQQATLQIYSHRKHRIQTGQDVEIERTIWAYRNRGKKLGTV